MAKLPLDYPTKEEIEELLRPIPHGIESRRREGWLPSSDEELLSVALDEIREINRLISAGWQPRIWGAEKKLLEPLLTVYALSPSLLSPFNLMLLRSIVSRKFFDIREDLSSQEQEVLRNAIHHVNDHKRLVRFEAFIEPKRTWLSRIKASTNARAAQDKRNG